MHLPGDGVGHGDGEQEEPEYLQGGRTEPVPAGGHPSPVQSIPGAQISFIYRYSSGTEPAPARGHPSPVQSIPGAQIALIDGYSSGTEPALAVGSLYLGHRYLI